MPAQKLARVADAVRKACDGDDGVRDGLISDPERASSIHRRSCAAAPTSVVSDAAAGRRRKTGLRRRENQERRADLPWIRYGVESGMRIQGGPRRPLQTNVFRYLAHRDPTWDVLSFDLERDLPLAIRHAGFIEASDPNLSRFKSRGGKLIVYHGWANPGPSPASSIDYHQSRRDPRRTAARVDAALPHPRHGSLPRRRGTERSRFHRRAGTLARIERSADAIVASHRTGERDGRTRPLCPYPQVAKYKGTGSTDDASNFECVRR